MCIIFGGDNGYDVPFYKNFSFHDIGEAYTVFNERFKSEALNKHFQFQNPTLD
jgi:hypothetical protein